MNKKLLIRILLGAWFIFLFYVLFIPNKVHREGMVDQEQLSNKLFGEYDSYNYKIVSTKEITLSSTAKVKKVDLSQNNMANKIDLLKDSGWSYGNGAKEDQVILCNGKKNMMMIVFPRKINYKDGRKRELDDLKYWIINYVYAYKGVEYC
jgi:hypothetical protein